LFLVDHGVPYDVAFALDRPRRLAHAIVLGRFHGNEWDWNAMRWKDRE
jgi:hypothetical protein